MTRIIGVDMAKKTGPFFLMTHVWREYVTPVATIPCIKYHDIIDLVSMYIKMVKKMEKVVKINPRRVF